MSSLDCQIRSCLGCMRSASINLIGSSCRDLYWENHVKIFLFLQFPQYSIKLLEMKFITQVNYLFALTSNIKQWNLAAILKICKILFNSYIIIYSLQNVFMDIIHVYQRTPMFNPSDN